MQEPEPKLIELATPCGKVRAIEEAVFLLRFTADCMSHVCRCRDEGDRPLPDACCQHGADVDLYEKAAILGRAAEIAPILRPEFRDRARWFDESDPYEDDEYPSGTCVRTGLAGAGDSSGPTLYRLMRDTLADMFGVVLVRRLDAVERRLLGRRLPIAARV